MAIRLPKPKNPQPLPPIEPTFNQLPDADELFETQTSMATLSLSELHQGFNDSRFFDWHGRVCRVQYLAYSTFNALVALLILAGLFVMIGGFQGIATASREQLPISLLGAMSVAAVVLVYLQLAITKRRFNDLNKTGWLALIMVVPVVNVVVYLYLLAVEGTVGANYYGLPARPATNLKTVIMVLLPLLVISSLGILTQVVVPSYQDLVKNNASSNPSAPVTAASVAKPQLTNAQQMPASTAPAENLRTDTVVITGEQLGNGVASVPKSLEQAANQPMPPMNNQPVIATNIPEIESNVNSDMNQPINTTAANSLANANLSPNNSAAMDVETGLAMASNDVSSNKGAISYEDFVKTSEQQVFIDNTRPTKHK